jgi:uncharacterized membrane protein
VLQQKTDICFSERWFMNKGRLEAFSDGVLAVIITIMVLEKKSPEPSSVGLAVILLGIPFFYYSRRRAAIR